MDRHSDKYRRDKHDHRQKYLKANAHRGICLIADKIADQDVIHHALKTGDEIGQHRRPGDLPHGGTERAFDDRTVVFWLFGGGRCGCLFGGFEYLDLYFRCFGHLA